MRPKIRRIFKLVKVNMESQFLDRALRYDMPLDEAVKCSLISFDSTLPSNVSVGFPLDALVYTRDSLHIPVGKRIDEEDPYFSSISKQWSDTLKKRIARIGKADG